MPTITPDQTQALLAAIIDALRALTMLGIKLAEVAKQDAELTLEQDAKLDADIAALKDSPHWKVQ
jgi:hypothetical protein